TTLSGRSEFTDATGGMQPANALQSLASGHFANWSVGVTANIPLGFRLEHAAVRAAQIALAQNYYLIKDQEYRAKSELNKQYAEMQKWYALIQSRRAERIDYAK